MGCAVGIGEDEGVICFVAELGTFFCYGVGIAVFAPEIDAAVLRVGVYHIADGVEEIGVGSPKGVGVRHHGARFIPCAVPGVGEGEHHVAEYHAIGSEADKAVGPGFGKALVVGVVDAQPGVVAQHGVVE